METNILTSRWAALKAENPQIRIRNAAQELGVSEVELLAGECGNTVWRLRPEFQAILGEVETLGKVMALTRNEEIVHERKGTYLNPSLNNNHVGLFVGEDIDLRIFFSSWASAFAVKEGSDEKPRYSIQFFAEDGEAIHKIYLTPQSDFDAFETLVEKYKSDDQTPEQAVTPRPAPEAETPDSDIDVEKFQEAWRNLKDTHDFFGLLRKHKLARVQALRLAPEGGFAVRLKNDTLRATLNAAAERQIPIMAFVGNRGMIQIHTGEVEHIVDYNEWLNVLDPDFNLHVKEPAIAQTWLVRKPTEDGMVTALEFFNEKEEQILQLFGKRKPGIPELESWRELIAEIEAQHQL
ncbi:MAG: hemin-degrading factor [Bernardetiaceae bacterium]|nr:hemin-degrading factor [Bernardetiaceae bacterium]